MKIDPAVITDTHCLDIELFVKRAASDSVLLQLARQVTASCGAAAPARPGESKM